MKKPQRFSASLRLCAMLFLIFLLSTSSLYSQEAEQIETILNTKAVTNQQSAAFILQAAEIETENAFRYAQNQKWLSKNSSPNAQINLKQTSLLIMQAFYLKGGTMYNITKNAHYAYRELVYQDIIQGRTDPSMKVSGELLLFLVNRVLYMQNPNPWELPPAAEEE